MRVLLALLLASCGCSLILDSGADVCTEPSCAGAGDGGSRDDGAVIADGAFGTIALQGADSEVSSAETDNFRFLYQVKGADELLVVAAALRSSGQSFDEIAYGFQSLNFLAGLTSGDVRLEFWYLTNPAVGSAEVSMKASAPRNIAGGAMAFSGVSLASPFGDEVVIEGEGNSLFASVPSEPGELIVAIVGTYDSSGFGDFNMGGGLAEQIRIDHPVQALRLLGATRAGGPGAAISATMTGNPDFGVIAVPIKPAQ